MELKKAAMDMVVMQDMVMEIMLKTNPREKGIPGPCSVTFYNDSKLNIC